MALNSFDEAWETIEKALQMRRRKRHRSRRNPRRKRRRSNMTVGKSSGQFSRGAGKTLVRHERWANFLGGRRNGEKIAKRRGKPKFLDGIEQGNEFFVKFRINYFDVIGGKMAEMIFQLQNWS